MMSLSVSRRTFLGGSVLGATIAPAVPAETASPDLAQYGFPKDVRDRIEAGRATILKELQPTRAQLEHGLQLHYDSYVADLMGCVWTSAPVGARGQRLQKELDQLQQKLSNHKKSGREIAHQVRRRWRRLKTFESAFDPEWKRIARGLYQLTGLDLVVEDNAGHYTLNQSLRFMAGSQLVYSNWNDTIRISRASDLIRAQRQKKLGVVSQLQGVHHLWVPEQSLDNLDLFYGLGIRIAQLTHRHSTALGSTCEHLDDGGLTLEGREAIHRMNELGVIVDLAHASRRTSLEAIESSNEPVINSHTACEQIYDDADNRNIDDEYLRLLADKGGLVGSVRLAPPGFRSRSIQTSTTGTGTWSTRCASLASTMWGSGTDVTYLPNYTPHPMDWTNWPYWTVGLVCRGFSDGDIRKILGSNFLRFAEKVMDKAPWGAFGGSRA